MGTPLAAVQGIHLEHLFLDERMAGFRGDNLAAGSTYHRFGIPVQARIMHDARAGMILQQTLCDQPDDVIALDETAILVPEKTAVEITIPGNRQVRAAFQQALFCDLPVFRQQGVRQSVRKAAIRIQLHADELERQSRGQPLQDRSRRTIAGIGNHFQRRQSRHIYIRE